jgi:hypothetical protein
MIFLSKLFTRRKVSALPRLSKLAHETAVALLRCEIAATVRIDPERAAAIARAKLASLGAELAP